MANEDKYEMTKTDSEARERLLSEESAETAETANTSTSGDRSPFHTATRRFFSSRLSRFVLFIVGGIFAVFGVVFSLALLSGGISLRSQLAPAQSATGAISFLPATWAGFENLEYLLVFGDSYSAQNFNPEGPQPNESNPFGNPPSALQRSNVNYWAWWLTLHHNQSAFRTYNYANGGASISTELTSGVTNDVENCLVGQIMNKYLPAYLRSPSQAVWQGRNTLHVFFFGINDILLNSMSPAGNKHTLPQFRDAYFKAVEQVYLSGARTFLFLKVPPIDYIDRYPDQRKAGDGLIWRDWNDQVAAQVPALLKAKYPEIRTYVFDTFSVFATAIDDPSSFPETAHLKNTTHHCMAYMAGAALDAPKVEQCMYPLSEYFWVNGLHPTSAIMNAVASRIASDCFGTEKTGYCS